MEGENRLIVAEAQILLHDALETVEEYLINTEPESSVLEDLYIAMSVAYAKVLTTVQAMAQSARHYTQGEYNPVEAAVAREVADRIYRQSLGEDND